ncbi:hypothetical protein [Thermofilum pendens]
MAVLVLILVASLALYNGFQQAFSEYAHCNGGYWKDSNNTHLVQDAKWRKTVNVYVIGVGDRTGKAESALHKLGLNVKVSSVLDRSGIEWSDVVLIDSDWAGSIGVRYRELVKDTVRLRKPVACYGSDAGNKFIELVGRDFFLNELSLYIGGEPFSNKTPNLELPADVKLFSIITRRSQGDLLVPEYLVIESIEEDLERDIAELLNWLIDLGIVDGEVKHYSITEVNGFKYVGSIDWKTYYIKYCNNNVGKLQAKSEYYYYGERVGEVFYKWFLIYVNHLTTGYGATTWCGACPYANWALHKAKTEIDGHTDTFPGQVFDDMGPINAMTCVSSISYEVSAEVSGVIARVSVSYNPNQMSYTSSVDVDTGIVKWIHSPCQHVTDTTWRVEPSAIFYLDPRKEYGYEPLIVTHYFYSEVKGYTTPRCGGTAYTYGQSSYTAYVKSSEVSQG